MENDIKQGESPPILTSTTPEGIENELIALAYELVAQRLKDGSATAAETVHFLKMGSAKERLEKEKVKREVELMKAKTEALQSAKRVEELYTDAIKAMRIYAGYEEIDDE